MKKNIHPNFITNSKVSCLCGKVFETGSTIPEIKVEVCSNCHPVYTGVKRFVDTLGRVDKFMLAQKKASESGMLAKKNKGDISALPSQKSLREMLEEAKKSA